MRRCGVMYWLATGVELPGYVQAEAGFTPPSKCPAMGPNGASGTLATGCSGAWDLTFDGERQEWMQLEEGLWLGVERDATVRPADVARRAQCGGHAVRMLDADWVMPVARLPAGGSLLPQRRRFAETGPGFRWEVEACHARLLDLAGAWWDEKRGAGGFTDAMLDEAVDLALQVNYRIGLREMVALDAMPLATMRDIVDALVDWPTVERLAAAQAEKKSPAVG